MDRPAAVGNDKGFPLSLPLLRLYIEELEKNPVRTKAITRLDSDPLKKRS